VKRARGGGPRERAHGQCRRRVLRSVQSCRCEGRPVRGLYKRARQRDASLIPQHSAGLGRRVQHGSGDDPLGGTRFAVQCGTEMLSCSKDGRRKGDHGPDLEVLGNESHGRRRGRDSLSTARGAARTGRAPGAPAALWSAAELFFSRSTRL
jgi:hypothetical protein